MQFTTLSALSFMGVIKYPYCSYTAFLIIDHILGNEVLVHFKTDHVVTEGGFKMEYKQKSKFFEIWPPPDCQTF